jgi:hypothetical protein
MRLYSEARVQRAGAGAAVSKETWRVVGGRLLLSEIVKRANNGRVAALCIAGECNCGNSEQQYGDEWRQGE